MADEPKRRDTAADLLADWRGAARETVAARNAAHVAQAALQAATAAEEAAREVESAAEAAAIAVERARQATKRALQAAERAATAAKMAISGAEGDQARTAADVVNAQESEQAASDRFHRAQDKGFP
jgi:hypothetical protein